MKSKHELSTFIYQLIKYYNPDDRAITLGRLLSTGIQYV